MALFLAAMAAIEQNEMMERRQEAILINRGLRDNSDPFVVGDELFRMMYR